MGNTTTAEDVFERIQTQLDLAKREWVTNPTEAPEARAASLERSLAVLAHTVAEAQWSLDFERHPSVRLALELSRTTQRLEEAQARIADHQLTALTLRQELDEERLERQRLTLEVGTMRRSLRKAERAVDQIQTRNRPFAFAKEAFS